MTTDKIKQTIEYKIRSSYKGIISDEQIEETIKWWIGLVDQARQEERERIEKEIVERIDGLFGEDEVVLSIADWDNFKNSVLKK